ncbi:hypothetical protein EUGRSUZ_D00705 [Eucalyptus grandis]|uniref:Uncharacterized protein n=2 Tax=Eucalyptus grandis TaxID=71139 RepID=A0ACC3L354_EUCGR|nr:hypothetical protein EUGRSUZ_D00705 [Eucalyptus grandis]
MASLKALLVSAGAVSIAAVALRASVPSTSADTLAAFISCFRPPYHFVVVNGIIIAIAATSRIAVVEVVQAAPLTEAEAFDEFKDFEEKRVAVVVEGNGRGFGGGDGYNGDCEGEWKVASERSASAPRRQVDSSEKALVSPRFVRRKTANGDRLQGRKGKMR